MDMMSSKWTPIQLHQIISSGTKPSYFFSAKEAAILASVWSTTAMVLHKWSVMTPAIEWFESIGKCDSYSQHVGIITVFWNHSIDGFSSALINETNVRVLMCGNPNQPIRSRISPVSCFHLLGWWKRISD